MIEGVYKGCRELFFLFSIKIPVLWKKQKKVFGVPQGSCRVQEAPVGL